MSSNKNVFISYTRKDPDVSIANELYSKLKEAGLNPYLSTHKIEINKPIEDIISSSAYFIPLLSERSLMSDMLTEEIKVARTQCQQNKLTIIPVRINLPVNSQINYDVSECLKGVDQKLWETTDDTNNIIKEITEFIIAGINTPCNHENIEEVDVSTSEYKSLPVPNAPLVYPGGNITPSTQYYITRVDEDKFIEGVLTDGSLLRIKGPRQFGKTSLLSRVIHFAKEKDYHVIPLSFQQIRGEQLMDLDKLLIQLCAHTSRKMKKPAKIKTFWDDEYMDVKMKCTTYFEEYLLEGDERPILLAIDEADRIFEYSDVSAEFFGMLRFWHEERNTNKNWAKFNLAVSHSTEAYLAINQMNQSPFNVGIERVLNEFNFDEVDDFANRHGLKLTKTQIDDLMDMIGGHPYLIHKALYEIASGGYTYKQFLQEAPNDDGPYSDHLRRHHWNLSREPKFINTMKDIVNNNRSEDTLICNKLRAAGLIKGTTPKVSPNSKLYEMYFKNRL